MADHMISTGMSSSGIVLEPSDRMTVCGGTVNNTTVNRCSELVILSGGIANGTIVPEGGKLIVSSGGIANGTTLEKDGVLFVSSGGITNGTNVSSGGVFIVFGGATANGTNVSSGGDCIVFDGGTENGTNIRENGLRLVLNREISNNVSRQISPGTPMESSGETASADVPNPGLAPCPVRTMTAADFENTFTVSDLTQCNYRDPVQINAAIHRIDPAAKETDRLQVVSLFYAVNTGESLASDRILSALGFTYKSKGQFVYYKRIVNLLAGLAYRIEVVRDDAGSAAEEIARAGIDGFDQRNLDPLRIYRFFEERSSSLTPQDITHLVSFLYSVAKRTMMPSFEYRRFEHGPTIQQYGSYHRAIQWLTRHGYRIAVREISRTQEQR